MRTLIFSLLICFAFINSTIAQQKIYKTLYSGMDRDQVIKEIKKHNIEPHPNPLAIGLWATEIDQREVFMDLHFNSEEQLVGITFQSDYYQSRDFHKKVLGLAKHFKSVIKAKYGSAQYNAIKEPTMDLIRKSKNVTPYKIWYPNKVGKWIAIYLSFREDDLLNKQSNVYFTQMEIVDEEYVDDNSDF